MLKVYRISGGKGFFPNLSLTTQLIIFNVFFYFVSLLAIFTLGEDFFLKNFNPAFKNKENTSYVENGLVEPLNSLESGTIPQKLTLGAPNATCFELCVAFFTKLLGAYPDYTTQFAYAQL